MAVVSTSIRQTQVLRIYGKGQRPQYGPRINFLVGGNILGRGLTIDDLLVTYYLRQAQVSQMDTVLQHARMYGYRESLMPYTRVYLPRQLAILFREIHQSEESLRGIVSRRLAGEDVPVRVAGGSRATRPGALETGALRVYDGDLGQVSPYYMIRDAASVEGVRRLLLENNVPLNELDRERRSRRVPLAAIRSLVDVLEPREDDPGRWLPDAVLGLIGTYEGAYGGEGIVYVRRFDNAPDETRTRARLSGPEIEIIRAASPRVPALALLHWGRGDAPELWYPTLVFPTGMPTYVFCPS